MSALSRELAEGADSHEQQAAEITAMREEIDRMQQDHAARQEELQKAFESNSQALQHRSDELDAAKTDHQRQVCLHTN